MPLGKKNIAFKNWHYIPTKSANYSNLLTLCFSIHVPYFQILKKPKNATGNSFALCKKAKNVLKNDMSLT